MKELAAHLKEDNREQQIASIPKKTEYALMGVIKPKPGQKVFEFDLSTDNGREAQYKNSNADFMRAVQGDYSPTKDLVIVEGRIYIPALNLSNATDKYKKSKTQSDYYAKEPPFKFTEHFY